MITSPCLNHEKGFSSWWVEPQRWRWRTS